MSGLPIHITAAVAKDWIAGIPTSTGNPEMDKFLDDCQRDQDIWDATVLLAFESTTGIDGVENFDAFEAWLNTPQALPTLTAYKSARAGVWISPMDYNAAFAFWQAAARATA